MFKPRMDTPAGLARYVGPGHPGMISRATLADAGRVAEGFEGEEALDVMVSLLDWHVSAGPARLARMLDADPTTTRARVIRGRRALGRAGLRPDGSPMAAGSPGRRG